MDTVMTWEEIEAAFDSEWVLIEDPELTRSLEIVSGKVIFHSQDGDEVYGKATEWNIEHSAILYIGNPQEHFEVLL